MEGDGSLRVEKKKEETTKQRRKKVKFSAEQGTKPELSKTNLTFEQCWWCSTEEAQENF